jgi:hypothetical protein
MPFVGRATNSVKLPSVAKSLLAGCSKGLRGEAREKSTSGGVLTSTLE